MHIQSLSRNAQPYLIKESNYTLLDQIMLMLCWWELNGPSEFPNNTIHVAVDIQC